MTSPPISQAPERIGEIGALNVERTDARRTADFAVGNLQQVPNLPRPLFLPQRPRARYRYRYRSLIVAGQNSAGRYATFR
jgi:hypothetical protein